MSQNQEILCCICDHICPEFFTKTILIDIMFVKRFIYLLQELGYDMGYKFDWYPHGPSSGELENALWYIEDKKLFLKERMTMLSDKATYDILKLNATISNNKGEMLDSVRCVANVMASLHFLKTHNFLLKDKPKETIVDVMIKERYRTDRMHEMDLEDLTNECLKLYDVLVDYKLLPK